MKYTTDMDFTEFVEWSEGYILKELIAGSFHGAVHTVCDQSIQRYIAEQEREKQSKKKNKK